MFGNISVQPVISPSGPVKDLDGNIIADAFGRPGFPNAFSPTATQSLGYAATLFALFGFVLSRSPAFRPLVPGVGATVIAMLLAAVAALAGATIGKWLARALQQ